MAELEEGNDSPLSGGEDVGAAESDISGQDMPAEEEQGQYTGEPGADEAGAQEERPVDPYAERFSTYERRIAQLEDHLRRAAEQQHRPRGLVPEALSKPQDQWTRQDLIEYNNWQIEQRLLSITAEQEVRGQFNAAQLGSNNDYDSVVKRNLYENELIANNPQALQFVRTLDPVNKYFLGLTLEIARLGRGDHVRVIKALRGALAARQEGARDLQRAVTSQARKTQMGVVRGGRATGATPLRDPWAGTDAEFLARMNRR